MINKFITKIKEFFNDKDLPVIIRELLILAIFMALMELILILIAMFEYPKLMWLAFLFLVMRVILEALRRR